MVAILSLVLSQIVVSTEVALGLAATIVGSVVTALVFIFRLLISNYEKRLLDVTVDRDNWKQVGIEAAGNLRKAANAKRIRDGKEPYEDLVPVVPEHNSPVTKKQEETAELQTVRASLVAATLDLGLPPRAIEVAKAVDLAEKATEVAVELSEQASEKKNLEQSH